MKSLLRSTALLPLALLVLALLPACAAAARPEAMVPEEITAGHQHDATVRLTVQGGKKTNPMGATNVSDASFMEALAQAIETHGVFSAVVAEEGAERYILDVAILDVDGPALGLNMNIAMQTIWTLVDASTGQILHKDPVNASFRARMKDAFLGTERYRIGVEGSARETIRAGLEWLAQLELAPSS